jgi:hypothetical protein
MNEVGIEIKLGFEDEHMLNLIFTAYNGRFQGQLEWYCYPEELKEIGSAFSPFPAKIPDDYLYENGKPENDIVYLYYFAVHAYTIDRSGHCALEITIKANWDKPRQEHCSFSIEAEAWAIHRLGELLKKFSTLKYSFLKWSLNPDNDLLVDRSKEDY